MGATPQGCFELSLSLDAHSASMSGSGERAVAGVTSGTMALGETVSWRARHFGIPFRMTSVISEYDKPHRFVDEQVSEPFAHAWHEHVFAETAEGGTTMVDSVHYRAPRGVPGSLAERPVLGRYMPHLLDQRNEWLRAQLESASEK